MRVAASLDDRINNFNVLRLMLAALVIVSHSSEMIYGNASHEVLTCLVGTVTSGGLAVDGFFLISGYLVTKSFIDTKDTLDYLKKRVLRIFPGFLFCYVLCVTVVAYLAGAHLPTMPGALKIAAQAVFLRPPHLNTEFTGLAYPQLDGPMWTISFEFRCYILVAVLGLLGALRRRRLVLGIGLALLAMLALQLEDRFRFELAESIRLVGMFLIGACFYLYRDKIPLTGWGAAVAALVMIVCLFFNLTAQPGLALAGGYCLFWFAFKGPGRRVSAAIRTDVSYGLYLYAWPVQALLIYYVPGIEPVVVGLATLVIATGLAFVSWTVVEHPAMRLAKRPLPRWLRPARPVVVTGLVPSKAQGAGISE